MCQAVVRGERAAAAFQVGGAVTAQIGAAIGSTAIPIAGPGAVIAVRQGFAAIVFLAVARPPVHRMRWRQLWPALLLAAAVVVMNLGVYFALERLGLGLTVTLEFLGPLAVALVASRRPIDAVLAIAAFGGVALLTGTVPGIDVLGIAFALAGGVGWAGYIVFSQIAGRRLPGLQGTAIAISLAALCTCPLLVIALLRLDPASAGMLLLLGGASAILSTFIPQAIDMTVLRWMRRELFGVLQSAQPAIAALVGFIGLGQTISGWQIGGLALICVANAIAVLAAGRPRRRADGRQEPPTAPIPIIGAGDG